MSGLDLGASYVLDVVSSYGEVRVDLEAAQADEQARRGVLILPHARTVDLRHPDGAEYGSVTRFRVGAGSLDLEGEWGSLHVESGLPEFHPLPLPEWALPGTRYFRDEDVLVRQVRDEAPQRWSERDTVWSPYPEFRWAKATGLGPRQTYELEPAAFVLDDLRDERARPEAERPTGASTAALDRVITELARPAGARDAATIGHLVTDGWRWQAPLSERVLALSRRRGGSGRR